MYAEQNDDFNRRSIQHTIIGKYIKSKREIMNDLIKIEWYMISSFYVDFDTV